MWRSTDNQHGFALVYGLVVLLLACVGGTALLFLARKDHMNASDYSQMRNASLAAMAALKSFEGQMRDDPNGTLNILKEYVDDQNDRYLFGPQLSHNEVKVNLWGDDLINGIKSPQYSAKIVSFDQTNYFISLEAKGYGSNGGIRKIIATYELAGLGLTDCTLGSSFGLFLNGMLENCNARIYIKGDVYLSMNGGSSNQHFNLGGKIEGNLKTASNTNVMDFSGSGALAVTGKALFLCKVQPQAVLKVSKDAVFSKDFVNFTSTVMVDGNVYVATGSNFGNANCIDGDNGGGKTAYYRYATGVSSDRFKDFTYKANLTTYTETYLASQLGMTATAEVPFGLNLPASWGTNVAKSVSGSVSGSNLDTWWGEKQAAGLLYQNEWLILNQTGGISMTGGTFTKKVIWVTNGNTITVNKNWPGCALTSNTLLIVNGTGFLSNMGVPNGSNFRGLIYHSKENTTTNTQYAFGGSSTVYGAIQHAGNAKFNLNGSPGDSLKIFFTDPIGQTAIQEIVNTGVILGPGIAAPEVRVLDLADTKIRSTLASLQM